MCNLGLEIITNVVIFFSALFTREAVLDSHFLVLASNLGSQQAQQLQTHLVTFEPDVFAQKLVSIA